MNYINTINLSDNIQYLRTLPDASADVCITDSPYGFGKEPDPIKTVTDWVTMGYTEIKGRGFMGKSWDAFVPQPALWKQVYRVLKPGGYLLSFFGTRTYDWGTLAIRLAGFEIRDCIQWIYGSGFPKSKSCLKPANEPICVARKPGPLRIINIDDARIKMVDGYIEGLFGSRQNAVSSKNKGTYGHYSDNKVDPDAKMGRWPPNVIFDEYTADLLDQTTGTLNQSIRKQGSIRKGEDIYFAGKKALPKESYNDFGGASRFFYVAKASPSERKCMQHVTIKPLKLMLQLVKLYSSEGDIVLDPHCGSGATLEAAHILNRKYIGIDIEQSSIDDSNLRLSKYLNKLF